MTDTIREQVLAALRNDWAAYVERFHHLAPEAQAAFLAKQGYVRLADLLAHVTAWWTDGSRAIENLCADPHWVSPDYNVDAFNAQAVAGASRLDEAAAIEAFADMRQRMLDLVSRLPEAAFQNKRIVDRLQIEVIGHLAEHALAEESALGENKVMQIGIVVENIEAAVQAWARLLGVPPPAMILTDTVDKAHTQYQGRTTPAQARLAFFNLGQVTLELIQPVGEPSTWNDQLAAQGPSLHHIAFEIKDMDKHISGLAQHGLPLIQRGDYTGGRYAYVDGQKQFGAVIELLEND